MPHVSLSRTDLDRVCPSVTVPTAVDAEDGNDLVDPTSWAELMDPSQGALAST